MAVAYEAWRAKVHVRQHLKTPTTTTACLMKKNRECKICCSSYRKKEEKKKKKKQCPCPCTTPCESSMPAACKRVKNLGDDCCRCCVALCQYIGEYVKFFIALICLKNPHPKFCCRLCNLIRATAIVWQDGCDIIRSVIHCLLGMH
ncbi:unnamed protein product [Arctia plantaginis]|uniref:Uncharacterized protein n=1 Tax=Arctia plantaginis TaxID=874455 RepID=A0A8S0ZE90_ARCPL|nr:unnamed protein product [Arctia plantaginis]